MSCRNCDVYKKSRLTKFNSSKARDHLISSCPGISTSERTSLARGTQANRRAGDLFALMSSLTESVATLRRTAYAGKSRYDNPHHKALSTPSPSTKTPPPTEAIDLTAWKSKGPHQPTGQPSLTSTRNFGDAMTKADADKIIIAEVKAILSRGEPPTRLLDDYVRAALLQRHPALFRFLPHDAGTIYNKYIVPIDAQAEAELATFISRLPGCINVAMDGVSVNGCQKVSYYHLFCCFWIFHYSHLQCCSDRLHNF